MKRILTPLTLLIAFMAPANAATIHFNLLGKGGAGLISTNENHAISGTAGSGGVVGAGIFYDDVTKVLTINIGWGSANGFSDLTGNASAGHIHGPTASGGTASFTENAGVIFGFSPHETWNPSATGGGVVGRTIVLSAGNEADLLAGKYYINIHTGANSGGEIRGNLVAIPEPTVALLGLCSLGLLFNRRRS
jgi:hypothetical protein